MAGRLRAPTGRYGGKTAEQRQAERRGRFLDAALRSFGGAPGYRGTTVASLSEAAGLSTRQFYEEFRTLEDVLAALHLQVNAWAEEAVVAAASPPTGQAARRTCHRDLPRLRRQRHRRPLPHPDHLRRDRRRQPPAGGAASGPPGPLGGPHLRRGGRRPRSEARGPRATTAWRPRPSSAASTASCTTGAPAGWTRPWTRWSTNWSASCWPCCGRRNGSRVGRRATVGACPRSGRTCSAQPGHRLHHPPHAVLAAHPRPQLRRPARVTGIAGDPDEGRRQGVGGQPAQGQCPGPRPGRPAARPRSPRRTGSAPARRARRRATPAAVVPAPQ